MGDTASALERHYSVDKSKTVYRARGVWMVKVSVRWSCGRSGEFASNSPDVFMASQADPAGRGDSSVGPAEAEGGCIGP